MPKHPLDIFTEQYLSDFNPEKPTTWKLLLPYSRFEELEQLIASNKEEALSHPIASFVYIAEWYKWRYNGHGQQSSILRLTSDQLRQLFTDAGIDPEKYVAVNPETGRHSWLYSIFVLGGLPIRYEIDRKTTSSFLCSICKIYHGYKDETTADFNDAGRAEAFQKALQPEGSLRGFVKELIDGGKPFAAEDETNMDLPIQQFHQMLVDANNKVRKNKFDIRHILTVPPESDKISRKLELHLCPEITGVGLGQYLSYDRVMLWKYQNPKEIEWIEIFVRFKKRNDCVEETQGLATFTNTKIESRGFVGWNLGESIIVKNVPVSDFDRIEVWARDNFGNEKVVQESDEKEIIQLYHTDNYCEWSSHSNPQRSTAVLWSSPWKVDGCPSGLDTMRRFVNRRHEISDKVYHFTLIPDQLTLIHPDQPSKTFHNHQGHDHLIAKGHYDTIAYNENDEVCFIESGDEDDEDEIWLPLIYSKDDLQVIRNYNNDYEDDIEVDTDIFEWKSSNRYVEWTDDNAPEPGRIKIRSLIRGRQLVREFLYLGGEVSRDLPNHEVCYPEGKILDDITETNTPLCPTIPIKIPLHNGVCILNVWRPIDIKEINIGNRNYFRTNENSLSVPAMVCDEAWVSLFGSFGYIRYSCLPLTNVFSMLSNEKKIAVLSNCSYINATAIDPMAPNDLNIVMAYKFDPKTDDAHWVYWDYVGIPQVAAYTTDIGPNKILFQNRNEFENPLKIYAPVLGPYKVFKYRGVSNKVTLLECFETAAKYQLYFFATLPFPLRSVNYEQFNLEVVDKLKERYGTPLPPKYKHELARAAKELNLKNINKYEI